MECVCVCGGGGGVGRQVVEKIEKEMGESRRKGENCEGQKLGRLILSP